MSIEAQQKLPGNLIKVRYWMAIDCSAVIIKAFITQSWNKNG